MSSGVGFWVILLKKPACKVKGIAPHN